MLRLFQELLEWCACGEAGRRSPKGSSSLSDEGWYYQTLQIDVQVTYK